MKTIEQRILGVVCLAAAGSAIGCGDEGPLAPSMAGAGGGSTRGEVGGATSVGGEGGSGAGGRAEGGAGYGGYGDAGPVVCEGPGARFVTEVVELAYGPGQDFGRAGMPDIVYGPPMGGGDAQGSLDVVSLGNGGVIAVAFAGNAIVDGPGADFVVFENPFETAGGFFAELATVEVSLDGQTWHAFPCDAVRAPYGACAGHTPVWLAGDDAAFDPVTSGGDAFDLADVGVPSARYVRITDRPDLDGLDGVFDLDAVGIVHAACP